MKTSPTPRTPTWCSMTWGTMPGRKRCRQANASDCLLQRSGAAPWWTFRQGPAVLCVAPGELPDSAAVGAARVVGFHDRDGAQAGQRRLELPPQPHGKVFAGGIVQSGDVVQTTMIERGVDGPPGRLDVSEIQHPAERGIDVAADGQLDLERMTVQARAGVRFRQGRQPARALQVEDAEDVHAAFSRMSPALAMQALPDTVNPATLSVSPVLLRSDHVGATSVDCGDCRVHAAFAPRLFPRQRIHAQRAGGLCPGASRQTHPNRYSPS